MMLLSSASESRDCALLLAEVETAGASGTWLSFKFKLTLMSCLRIIVWVRVTVDIPRALIVHLQLKVRHLRTRLHHHHHHHHHPSGSVLGGFDQAGEGPEFAFRRTLDRRHPLAARDRAASGYSQEGPVSPLSGSRMQVNWRPDSRPRPNREAGVPCFPIIHRFGPGDSESGIGTPRSLPRRRAPIPGRGGKRGAGTQGPRDPALRDFLSPPLRVAACQRDRASQCSASGPDRLVPLARPSPIRATPDRGAPITCQLILVPRESRSRDSPGAPVSRGVWGY